MSTIAALPLIKQKRREASRSFWKLMYEVVLACGATHMILACLFFGLQANTLAWYNVASVIVFGISYELLLLRRNTLASVLIVSEILIHGALAVLMIGWDSGFHYYLVIMIPVVVISSTKRPRSKILLSTLIFVLYLSLDYSCRTLTPLTVLSPEVLMGLRYFNLAVTFVLLYYLSGVYLKLVIQADKKLRVMATTDPLTHLLNRRCLLDLADYELTQRKRTEAPLSFVLADVDHFKSINDHYGHSAGDDVLKAISQILSQTVREQDSIARWGGEEFLILMPHANLEAACMVAERLREKVALLDLKVNGKPIPVTVTLGVSQHRTDEPIETAVSRADTALYEGKRMGRNRVMPEAG